MSPLLPSPAATASKPGCVRCRSSSSGTCASCSSACWRIDAGIGCSPCGVIMNASAPAMTTAICPIGSVMSCRKRSGGTSVSLVCSVNSPCGVFTVVWPVAT